MLIYILCPTICFVCRMSFQLEIAFFNFLRRDPLHIHHTTVAPHLYSSFATHFSASKRQTIFNVPLTFSARNLAAMGNFSLALLLIENNIDESETVSSSS